MNKNEQRDILAKEVKSFLESNKIKKFKLVKNKNVTKKANSMTLSPCPECGSKLVVESSGVIVCSQDKLKDIYQKCLEYEKASEKEKVEILKSDKTGNFIELYDRWKHKDAQGNRSSFTCLYSNRLHSPVPSYSWFVYEVFQVRRLERSLKRRLTENELDGLIKVRYKTRKGQWKEELVEKIRFPWDLL